MSLSVDLISQFVKVTKTIDKKKNETTVYGTTVTYNGSTYVRLDGSDLLTPVKTTASTKPGERVTVTIKNHSATITGNLSSPSASSGDVSELSKTVAEFGTVVADKVSAEELEAEKARIDDLVAENAVIKQTLSASNIDVGELKADYVEIEKKLEANEASIEDLEAKKLDADVADIKYASVENLEATNAEVHNLSADYADFKVVTADQLAALDAIIKNLNVDNLDAKFANIDFTNIGEAAIREFFTKSGMIENIVIGDATITGSVVGVTLKGDLIEAGTIKADKLVIKNDKDGLYYKLNIEGGATVSETLTEEQLQNGLHGNVIISKSITAEKISVKDLVAFGATIGGMTIDSDAIHSMAKDSVDNTVEGFFFGADGQFSVGGTNSYLKFYYDETEEAWKLAISANDILFSTTQKSVSQTIDDVDNSIRETITQQNNETLNAAGSMIDASLEGYVKQDEYEEYKKGAEENLNTTAANIGERIDKAEDNTKKVDQDLNDFKGDIATYFEFSPEGLVIRKHGSDFRTVYSNNQISFYYGGNIVAYIKSDKMYIQDAHFIHGISFGNSGEDSEWSVEVDDYGWGISYNE